jgi:flagellar hook-length control protein FliK
MDGEPAATLASTVSPSADGVPLTGMTAASTETLDPDLLAAMQATAQAREAGAASAESTMAASSAGSAQAAGSTPADMASLAADFGAQIVASTGSTTRSAGPGAAPTGQAPLVDEAQAPTPGSTAQSAGAGAAVGVQLPGQAVAATGASSQGTSGTLDEALEAGPEGVSATQAAEAPTDFQATLGVTGTNGVSQAQDVDAVQVSATSAPPVATQIADGALMAARRIGQSVEMILQPEGLGSVALRVTAERAGLAVHIAVDNPQAREMVQASWPQLQQALEQRGLTVQSLLLDLSNGRDGGQGFQAFQQFNGQQQFTGQQARNGSANADRRDSLAIGSIDDGTPAQSSAATASRVDYRI